MQKIGRKAGSTSSYVAHRMSGTPEYRAFISARARCQDPRCKAFAAYGARGIEFRFTSFAQWFDELGPRPEGKSAKGRSLWSVDRKNNDGHYEPGNVRWATWSEQRINSTVYTRHRISNLKE